MEAYEGMTPAEAEAAAEKAREGKEEKFSPVGEDGTGLVSELVASNYLKVVQSRAAFIPLRLNERERALLTVVEGALDVSEYTDKVDVSSNMYFARASYDKFDRIYEELTKFASFVCGLSVSHDFKSQGRKILENTLKENADLVAYCVEVGRRYKIMNPDKMRSSYGKLLYIVMDSVNPRVSREIDFSIKNRIRSVYTLLQTRKHGMDILSEPALAEAAMEIEVDSPEKVAAATQRKIEALSYLVRKFTVSDDSEDETNARKEEKTTTAEASEDEDMSEDELPALTQEEIHLVVASLSDNSSFLRSNRGPVDRMIHYLKTFFSPNAVNGNETLEIRNGRNGSCLSHSHETQYYFVLQSLTLWQEIMGDFFRLWFLAEGDLLAETNGYRLLNTGQGMQRCQSAPRVSKAMSEILGKVRSKVGKWVGLSVVHLGDRDVPNALTFIDKYTQVPRILGPIVSVLDQIGRVLREDPGVLKYAGEEFGDPDGTKGTDSLEKRIQKSILLDFFKHGFDGSGDDGGSCIDGRLTSCWNWCSKLEKKSYYPIFLLCGHTGFEGSFDA